jgi:hypothetical protein
MRKGYCWFRNVRLGHLGRHLFHCTPPELT